MYSIVVDLLFCNLASLTHPQFCNILGQNLNEIFLSQMADSTTLTSNLGTTSSVGNHTPSVTQSNGALPISPSLIGTEKNNMGSMNNKLDCNSIQDETLVKVQESPAEPTTQTSETQSGISVNQALPKEAINVDEGGQTNGDTSTSSNSEFEVVDETSPGTTVKV